jgi:hypothetical protein
MRAQYGAGAKAPALSILRSEKDIMIRRERK